MLNRITLIGRLGADPELKHVGESAVLRLRLATSEKYKDRNGERQERTEWHTVNLWGKRAEALSAMLTKGQLVYLEGRIETRQWDDKTTGTKRSSTEVVATELLMLSASEARRTQQAASPQHRTMSAFDDDFDSPF